MKKLIILINFSVKAAPYAINQIVHKTNDRVEHDMELTVKHKVPIVIIH